MKVLFVCIENSCRSQMAEAFARIHGGDGVEAYSAGSRPSGVVNPKSIESMGTIGYDMAAHRSKGLDEIPRPKGGYDHVITMGCGDECPFIAARHHDDWVIPDPKNMPPEEFAKVRDLIGEKVRVLLASDSAS